MEVKDKIMYHYHKLGKFDEKWQVGNQIIVDNSFNSFYCTILADFSTSVYCRPDNHLESFDNILDYYLNNKDFEKLDQKLLRQMLEESRRIIANTNIYKRERALEDCRKDFFPHLPSRLHSIWVSDERELSFWKKQFKQDLILFKLSLTGELFKSSDSFIPDDELSPIESYVFSKKYWDPTFETEEQEKKVEYLFQGKVKILEKLK